MKKVILAGALAFAPALVFAQQLGGVETFVRSIGRLINIALPLVVGLALLAFFWGLVKYIFAQGSEEAKADAKKVMLWAVVALFVMVSVWGLVNFIGAQLNIGQDALGTTPTVPNIPQ